MNVSGTGSLLLARCETRAVSHAGPAFVLARVHKLAAISWLSRPVENYGHFFRSKTRPQGVWACGGFSRSEPEASGAKCRTG